MVFVDQRLAASINAKKFTGPGKVPAIVVFISRCFAMYFKVTAWLKACFQFIPALFLKCLAKISFNQK